MYFPYLTVGINLLLVTYGKYIFMTWHHRSLHQCIVSWVFGTSMHTQIQQHEMMRTWLTINWRMWGVQDMSLVACQLEWRVKARCAWLLLESPPETRKQVYVAKSCNSAASVPRSSTGLKSPSVYKVHFLLWVCHRSGCCFNLKFNTACWGCSSC